MSEAVQSLAEFYTDPASPYAAFPQEHRTSGSMPVRILWADQASHDTVDPAVPGISLVLSLKSEMRFRWDLGDGLTDEIIFRTGGFTFLPSNTEARFDCQGQHTVLALNFPAEHAAALLQDHNLGTLSSLDALSGQIAFNDSALQHVALQIWTESARVGGSSDLLIDGLTKMLFARLFDKAGGGHPTHQPVSLDPLSIARINQFLEQHLEKRITLEHMAAVLDMPLWTFADAFRATTGTTPDLYVTTKRIERACDFLRSGDRPITEVAQATGFVSPTNLNDTFLRVFGVTPANWRREIRS